LSVADDEESLKFLIKAYVFSMFFYSLHSLWEYHNGRYEFRMGISRMVGVDSTFNDPNAFGGSVVLSLPFVYALLRAEVSAWQRKLYYGYFAIAVTCVVLTGSRSAFVALLFLSLLWAFSQKGARKFKIITIAIPVVFLVWTVMPEEKQNRIRTLWDSEAGPANAQESAEGRLEGFKVSWRMFEQVPFTGVGAGGKNFIGYRMANHIDEEGHKSPTQAHNLYGEVLAELGLTGAFLLIGLVVAIFRICMQIRSCLSGIGMIEGFSYNFAGAIIGVLLLLLFLGLGGHNFYRPMWLWLAAWSGALFKVVKLKESHMAEGMN
jgi:O-antigen ligase